MEEEGQEAAVGEEAAAAHHLQAWEVGEEEQQHSSKVEAGELVGKDRRRVRGQMEEEREGCRSQVEAGGPQSHRSEEGEEVQGEGQSGGESWAGERPWGEQVVGGWDSAR